MFLEAYKKNYHMFHDFAHRFQDMLKRAYKKYMLRNYGLVNMSKSFFFVIRVTKVCEPHLRRQRLVSKFPIWSGEVKVLKKSTRTLSDKSL